ncbi:MAG TPA: LysM peptidoglycan-binding domain-containing protein [Anaeromyxobacteraceae bacterium]|nr:LysM peptidoglycan-binding domain-containing protein [Anaeromyxobacteraceae bacterium]
MPTRLLFAPMALLFAFPVLGREPLAMAPEGLARAVKQELVPAAEPQPLEVGLPDLANDTEEEEADAGDAAVPEVERQAIEAQSKEMNELQEAEAKARLLEEPPAASDEAARAGARLGLESPLRQRLRDAGGREEGGGLEAAVGRIPGLPQIDHDLRRLQAEYDIPIEVNDAVVSYIRFFQQPLPRSHFVRWLGRSEKYVPRFRAILREEGLPEDTVYLSMIESGFANMAYSRARASGTWQFIAETGRRFGLKQDFWVDERRDPEKAARAAARYLKELYRQTGDWKLAWAGYNAGVGKIFKARRKGQADFWTMTRGRVLKAETKGYVPKLMAAAIICKHPDAFGFSEKEIEAEKWADYELVDVPPATPMSAVAKAAEVEEKDLFDLNPELRRSCTPPRTYKVKVPVGKGEVFARNWPAVSEHAGELVAHHKVQKGETLAYVARAYGVPAATLARMNALSTKTRPRPGTELLVPLEALARGEAAAVPADPPGSRMVKVVRWVKTRHGRRKVVKLVAARDDDELAAPRTRTAKAKGGKVTLAKAEVEDAPAEKAAPAKADAAGRLRSTVKVKIGDSLSSIAARYGVRLSELCRWNGIKSPRKYKLQAGGQLVVFRRAERSAAVGEATGPALARD